MTSVVDHPVSPDYFSMFSFSSLSYFSYDIFLRETLLMQNILFSISLSLFQFQSDCSERRVSALSVRNLVYPSLTSITQHHYDVCRRLSCFTRLLQHVFFLLFDLFQLRYLPKRKFAYKNFLFSISTQALSTFLRSDHFASAHLWQLLTSRFLLCLKHQIMLITCMIWQWPLIINEEITVDVRSVFFHILLWHCTFTTSSFLSHTFLKPLFFQ